MIDPVMIQEPAASEARETHIGAWPDRFPHEEIDELIGRLSDAGAHATVEETGRLLQLITREAERLRRAVVRLSVARLSAAEQEAHDILDDAKAWADEVRARALQALDDRLDEADRLTRAMRQSFWVEGRLRDCSTDSAAEAPNDGECLEPESVTRQ